VDAIAHKRKVYKIREREVVAFPEREEIAPPVRPLHEYWQETCGGALPVPKDKIDPLALPPYLLAHVLLVDVLFDPPDFRYRLIGTEITRFIGRDSTGRRLSEIAYPKAVGERITQVYSAVARSGRKSIRPSRDRDTCSMSRTPPTGPLRISCAWRPCCCPRPATVERSISFSAP